MLNRGYNHYETLWKSEGHGDGNLAAEPDAGAGAFSSSNVGLLVQRDWAERMIGDNKRVEVRNMTSHKKDGLRVYILSAGNRAVIQGSERKLDTIMGVGVFNGVIDYGKAIARTPDVDAVEWETPAQKDAFQADEQVHMVDAQSFATMLHKWSLQKNGTFTNQHIWGWRFSDFEKIENRCVPHVNGWETWAHFSDTDVYKETAPGHKGQSLDAEAGGAAGSKPSNRVMLQSEGGGTESPDILKRGLRIKFKYPASKDNAFGEKGALLERESTVVARLPSNVLKVMQTSCAGHPASGPRTHAIGFITDLRVLQ